MDTAGERRELSGSSRGIQEHPKALTQKHHKATAIARKLGMIMSSICPSLPRALIGQRQLCQVEVDL